MDAFVLKRSSRVMPAWCGTPALFIGRGDGVAHRSVTGAPTRRATEVKKDPELRTGRNDNISTFSASSALPTPVTPVTVAGVLQ